MQYLGGKHRIAKQLGAYLRGRLEGRLFVEPFCGALNITAQIPGPRLACDASPYLFSLYSALRAGWDPPTSVYEEQWQDVFRKMDPNSPLTAFVGYGCSFGGKFFGGYARGEKGRNYAASARNALLQKMALCAEVVFARCSYETLTPGRDCLIYCDPPCAGTTGYAAVGDFDSMRFWRHAQEWSEGGAVVLVSEYQAPAGWRCVWECTVKTDMHGAGRLGRVERLFEWGGA